MAQSPDTRLNAKLYGPVFSSLANLAFLSFGASALCFVTWNKAVSVLGALATSIYIYLVPVVTAAASVLVLREPVTVLRTAGIVLVLAGLVLSRQRQKD